ncbi:MAG: hypothetical protein H6Q73_921 [Firmicutes bacterium]|nr:hypothetical protein [Bacillota bacterium]
MADETTDTTTTTDDSTTTDSSTSTDTTDSTTDTSTDDSTTTETNLLKTAVASCLTTAGIDSSTFSLEFDEPVYTDGAIVQGTITAYNADDVWDFTDTVIAAQTASSLEVTTGYKATVHAIGDKQYFADRSVFVYYYEIKKIEEDE